MYMNQIGVVQTCENAVMRMEFYYDRLWFMCYVAFGKVKRGYSMWLQFSTALTVIVP